MLIPWRPHHTRERTLILCSARSCRVRLCSCLHQPQFTPTLAQKAPLPDFADPSPKEQRSHKYMETYLDKLRFSVYHIATPEPKSGEHAASLPSSLTLHVPQLTGNERAFAVLAALHTNRAPNTLCGPI